MCGELKDRLIQLLLRAVNNRTRERNYFRLYTRLLEDEITEDKFNKEIDEHIDDYVVSNDADFKPCDVELALGISSKIKDVNDLDSMADLFSFNMKDVKK